MYKRIELHNHTLASDGRLTPKELVETFHNLNIDTFALTDHNTITGHQGILDAIEASGYPTKLLPGFELTSYYGHILCQDIHEYIPWEDISPDNADLIFDRVHEAGGLVGPAHPFSPAFPMSNGMRFSMTIHDPSKMDFIEIINNAHIMVPDNLDGINWWKSLVYKGYKIAPVSGTDYHGKRPMDNIFTTYMDLSSKDNDMSASTQFRSALEKADFCITKGPLIDLSLSETTLTTQLLSIQDGFSNQFNPKDFLILRVTSGFEETDYLTAPVPDEGSMTMELATIIHPDSSCLVLEIFSGNLNPENLVALRALYL